MRKLKNKVICMITACAGVYELIYFMALISCLDGFSLSNMLKGGIVACLCAMWICLFAIANYCE